MYCNAVCTVYCRCTRCALRSTDGGRRQEERRRECKDTAEPKSHNEPLQVFFVTIHLPSAIGHRSVRRVSPSCIDESRWCDSSSHADRIELARATVTLYKPMCCFCLPSAQSLWARQVSWLGCSTVDRQPPHSHTTPAHPCSSQLPCGGCLLPPWSQEEDTLTCRSLQRRCSRAPPHRWRQKRSR